MEVLVYQKYLKVWIFFYNIAEWAAAVFFFNVRGFIMLWILTGLIG